MIYDLLLPRWNQLLKKWTQKLKLPSRQLIKIYERNLSITSVLFLMVEKQI